MKLGTREKRGGKVVTAGEVAGLPFRLPAYLSDDVTAAAIEAREARDRGEAIPRREDIPVSQQVARQQALVRRDALLRCLPDNRMNCTEGLACLDPDQHAEELDAWLNDPTARTIILAGRTGSGKTQAAYALAGQAARYGTAMLDRFTGEVSIRPLIVRAWVVDRYVAELRPEGSPQPIWAVRDDARRAEFLIGDDLGAELDDVASSHMRREISDLLDWRLEYNLRTVFTTNHSSKVVKERLGDRLWSRIQENATVLKFTGPDRRALRPLEW